MAVILNVLLGVLVARFLPDYGLWGPRPSTAIATTLLFARMGTRRPAHSVHCPGVHHRESRPLPPRRPALSADSAPPSQAYLRRLLSPEAAHDE